MLSDDSVQELNRLFGLDSAASAASKQGSWWSILPALDLGQYQVTPLTSARALASEGWNMQHCVANYLTACAAGLYQVFSIRSAAGRRLATLGLSVGSGNWKVDQCQGYRNANVSRANFTWIDQDGKHNAVDERTDLHYVAQEIARLLNRSDADLSTYRRQP